MTIAQHNMVTLYDPEDDTTLDLNQTNIANWSIRIEENSWQPRAIAPRQPGRFTGDPYRDIGDNWRLMIQGADAQAVWDTIHELQLWAEKITSYRDGIRAKPIWLRVQLRGLQRQHEVVVRNTSGVVLPTTTMKQVGLGHQLSGVAFGLTSRPILIDPSDSGAYFELDSTKQGLVMNATLPISPSNDVLSPADIIVSTFDASSGGTIGPGLFAISSKNAMRVILPTDCGTIGSTWSNPSNSSAVDGVTARYTPTTTNQAYISSGVSGVDTLPGRSFALYALLKNNSPTTQFLLTPVISSSEVVLGQPTVVDASTTDARVVRLGTVNIPQAAVSAGLYIQASAASGSLDIAEILVVDLDQQPTSLVWFESVNLDGAEILGTGEFYFLSNYRGEQNGVIPNAYGDSPVTTLFDASSNKYASLTSYGNDLILLLGPDIYAVLLCPHGPDFSVDTNEAVPEFGMSITKWFSSLNYR